MNKDTTDGRDIETRVNNLISGLWRRREADLSEARAQFAALRRAVDEEPGSTPAVWELVQEATPEALIGRGDDPSVAEAAVHTALTLYGVHQQGQGGRMFTQKPLTFGAAAGALLRGRTASTKSRYDALLNATTDRARRHHLRSLVGLMSTDGVPVNYGRLAQDLYWLRKSPDQGGVQRRWGRDFYKAFSGPSASGASDDHTTDND